MTKRRTKGDGGLVQRHDSPSCPPMGSGSPHPETGKPTRAEHTCKGRWQGTIDAVIDGQRKRKYVYGRTQREARTKLAAAVRERDAGTLIIGTTTVSQWLAQWLERRGMPPKPLKAQTLRSYRSKVRLYIDPHLGRHRLTALRGSHIEAMYDWMRDQGLAESTLRQTHAILGKALKDAVRKGLLSSTPMSRVDPPEVTTNKRRGLTLLQARIVLRRAGDDARWWLALFYGMRQGECLGLRWEDIDFERGTLTIAQSLQTREDGSLFFGPPKSGASSRTLPLLPQIETRLRLRWLEQGEPTAGLVFHRGGQPIRPRDDWQAWRDLLDAASMPPLAPIPAIALHAARNSAASLMEAAGIPERLIMQILGHSQVQTTRNYQIAELEQMREALRSAGRLLELD